MYQPDTLRKRFGERPYRPVRVVTCDGRRFDVCQAGMVLVSELDLLIGLPSNKPGIYSNIARVAISDLAALEDLPAPVSPGNGQQPQ